MKNKRIKNRIGTESAPEQKPKQENIDDIYAKFNKLNFLKKSLIVSVFFLFYTIIVQSVTGVGPKSEGIGQTAGTYVSDSYGTAQDAQFIFRKDGTWEYSGGSNLANGVTYAHGTYSVHNSTVIPDEPYYKYEVTLSYDGTDEDAEDEFNGLDVQLIENISSMPQNRGQKNQTLSFSRGSHSWKTGSTFNRLAWRKY